MNGWSAGLVRRLRPGRPHGRSPWRLGVPVVCLLAGLLLAATHGVSGGGEIRRSDAPRLVDLVRAEEASVDRLSAERDALAAEAGLSVFAGAELAVLRAADALERALT